MSEQLALPNSWVSIKMLVLNVVRSQGYHYLNGIVRLTLALFVGVMPGICQNRRIGGDMGDVRNPAL